MQPPEGPLVVLGGTFDPPHLGHLVLAECARVQLGASTVRFIPAGFQYRKSHAHSSGEVRLEMTRLAIADNPAFELDARELRRDGPSYTVDTLAELKREGRGEIVLVVGADALADMAHWKEPGRIRALARLAVAPRPGGTPSVGPPGSGGAVEIDMPPLPISSSLIRERVRAGLPIRYLVPREVEAYIENHGLYRLPEGRKRPPGSDTPVQWP